MIITRNKQELRGKQNLQASFSKNEIYTVLAAYRGGPEWCSVCNSILVNVTFLKKKAIFHLLQDGVITAGPMQSCMVWKKEFVGQFWIRPTSLFLLSRKQTAVGSNNTNSFWWLCIHHRQRKANKNVVLHNKQFFCGHRHYLCEKVLFI